MNDISLKIVESPKGVVASPAPEPGETEVDPLAIEEDVANKETKPAETPDCDENAKEESPDANEKDHELVAEEVKNVDVTVSHALTDDPTSPTTLTEEPLNIETETAAEAETTAEKDQPLNAVDTTPKPPIVEEYGNASTPDLNSPREPEPEPEEIQEPPSEPIEEVKIKEPSPKPPTPEAEVPKPQEPEVKESPPIEKPISTDVEMTELPAPTAKPEVTQETQDLSRSPPVEKSQVVEKETKMVSEEKVGLKVLDPKEIKPAQSLNGDIIKEEQSSKRRASEDVETDSPLKKLCQEVEKTFPQHDVMINDYIQTATKNNVDEIQRHTEQLLAEIQTLRELAQKKEHEWNNILHLKKVKEEILLRLLRRKQVLAFEKSAEVNGAERPGIDPFDYLNQAKNLAIDKSDEISGLALKQPGSTMNPMMQTPVMPVTTHFNPMVGLPPPYDKAAQMHIQNMPKPVFHQPLMMPGPLPGFPRDMNGQLPSNYNLPMGRQGPTKDVKSIIADYRQRNPDVTPRRGRRMKSILNPNMMNAPRAIAPKVDTMGNISNMNSMNNLNNLNILFNNLDMNQKAMLERLQQIQGGGLPNSIFKDALVQFANMQQANAGHLPTRPPETITNRPEHHVKERRRERNHEPAQHQPQQVKQPERLPSTSPRLPPPPPYPEISLLPVAAPQDSHTQQQNSLLHGILTKPAPQSFSPTLAILLTSPERKQSAPAPAVLPTFGQAKNCGEITITPVQPTPPPPDAQPDKPEEVVQLDDEESPASEGEASGSPAGSGSGRLVIDEGGGEAAAGEGGDAPLCQGCRRRDAQFVCAGCANQWYCSRDCQVAAWDEHSEMCSG